MSSAEDKLRAKVAELEASLREARSKIQREDNEIEAYEGLLKLAMEDMRRLYEDLLRTHSQLTQSDKLAALGLLSAGVIHEINNPLTVIQGSLFLLKENIAELKRLSETPDADPARRKTLLEETDTSLQRGETCTRHIAKIVKDIRVFSRASKDEFAEESVNDILDGVIGIAWNAMKNKVELKKAYGTLPKISCNPQQLGQVFLNLLVNATQAIEGRGMITVKTSLEDGRVLTQISDTGSGIPEDIRKRIFEPFFTTKDAETGTGLGLSVSADIVRKHGGTMEVESEVGRGTTFLISLPAGRNTK